MFSLVATLIAMLLASGCVVGPRYATIDAVPASADLPRPEQVAAIGMRAVQLWVASDPKAAESVAELDTNGATSTWVNVALKFPPELIVASKRNFIITVYALAHQWGATQISLDYLRRLEEFIGDRMEVLKSKQASLAWSNFFAALSSVGYGLAAGYSRNALDRLTAELAISRNAESIRFNNLLSEYYAQQRDDTALERHRVKQLKDTVTAYVKVLEIYRDWLFQAVEQQQQEMPADAGQVLRVGISSRSGPSSPGLSFAALTDELRDSVKDNRLLTDTLRELARKKAATPAKVEHQPVHTPPASPKTDTVVQPTREAPKGEASAKREQKETTVATLKQEKTKTVTPPSRTEASVKKVVYVKSGVANLYAQPGDYGNVIAKLQKGEALTQVGVAFGMEDVLYKVQTQKGVVGWVRTVDIMPKP